MVILGLGTAAPPQRYAQKECWEALQTETSFRRLQPRSQLILKKVLTGQNGISTRHLALEKLAEAFQITPDALHDRFARTAPLIASQAAQQALKEAHLVPGQVDALLISTCTGYLCPGLTSYISEHLGLRPDAVLLDLVGQGCGAALPNLRAADALLASGRCQRALSVCVEVCSAAFYLDDDPGVLISACLFGDGAGAAVLGMEANGGRRIEWKTFSSLLRPEKRDSLRFEQRHGMLRNVLTPEVPGLAAEQAERVLDETLRRGKLERRDISAWLFHPGGREVLTALQERLGLEQHDLRWSAGVLERFGNVSSASLFFVLQAALADAAPRGRWYLSSFGAGLSCHGAVLEVN